ncbi:HypC/HybG/HupF family hydrogenase formation chaperone [Ampullimonas aquatilis]|uniref:HypC/HybG/HupF family hydrogenase formation chaperone n=1 Tax=Ampullimonas aquatilis TaxID=1341549 RepID=UPI003C77CDBF
MCLAIPVKVIEVLPEQQALVDLGGVRKTICTALLDQVSQGEYVILHVGFAIGRIDAAEAERTLAMFGEIVNAD